MGTKTYGVTFTQTGVPVALSSDYQKVIDSRWIFMEIANEGDIAYSFSGAAGSLHYERIVIYRHNLGYMPAFESTIDLNGADPFDAGSPGVFADENTIFLRRIISGATIGCNVTGYYRLYALPILNDYEAPVELVSGASAPKTDYGMKFVNGQVPNVTPADNSVLGFSVDTTKKILSVHKTGLKYINQSSIAYQARVTAIDTTTNILTVTASGTADVTWISQLGIEVAYFPNDLSTFPAPFSVSQALSYTIPVDSTHIKLALSADNAKSGIAIDFTTAGSLPGSLGGTPQPGEDTIDHNMGYPPTYLLAPVNDDEAGQECIGPIIRGVSNMLIKATTTSLQFKGIQAEVAGKYGFIILKDPVEIAS